MPMAHHHETKQVHVDSHCQGDLQVQCSGASCVMTRPGLSHSLLRRMICQEVT